MATVIRARVTAYSNGRFEMGWSTQAEFPNPLPPRLPDPNQGTIPPPRYEDQSYQEGSIERAARRSKGMVRRIIKEHGFDHMVTLTTRANLTDYDSTQAMLRAFIKAVRKSIPAWRGLAVPERQERGAWHWHIAVQGWQNLFVLRHAWGAVCERFVAGGGNVDVKAPKTGGHSKWNTGRLSHYMTKYISKAMEEEREGLKGRHRYCAPLGLKTWAEFETIFPGDWSHYDMVCEFADLIGERIVDVIWAPNDRPGHGWIASD